MSAMMTTDDASMSTTSDDNDSTSSSLNDEQTNESASREFGLPSDTANTQQDQADFVQKETGRVSQWRMVVILMLLVSAGLVIISTFIFLSRLEDDEFEKSFKQNAQRIIDTTTFASRNLIGSISSMADSITSEAILTNATWPFVTIGHYEIKAAHTRVDSLTEILVFCPVVPGNLREEWESYSVRNQGWIDESVTLEQQTRTWFDYGSTGTYNGRHGTNDNRERPGGGSTGEAVQGPPLSHYGAEFPDGEPRLVDKNVTPFLYGFENGRWDEPVVAQVRPYYIPLWQTSPPPKSAAFINFDLQGDPDLEETVATMLSSGKPSITKVEGYSMLFGAVFTPEEHWSYHQPFADASRPNVSANAHPHSVASVPIKSGFATDDAVVGLLGAFLPWDYMLTRVLPDGEDGIFAVLENSCDQVYTYQVNGQSATYIGEGDLHDRGYDRLKKYVRISDSVDIDVEDGACDYVINIYPSDAYKSRYNTARPVVFTAVLASVFLATGLVFFIYVRYVQKRQSKILSTAIRSTAILSSLFPGTVKDRLLRDTNRTGTPYQAGAKYKLKNFLERESESDLGMASKPIADLFPETTVMFADIVGFTAWSSVREPAQVFTLLETVYRSFDEIANRRRVFKVETVGDCYVAVAGLPEPRDDHAVCMVRFAQQCNTKLNRLVKDLETSLGPDTGELSMRFGLHSGQVTAGVLRGERARFQLFGDTVNTAARMESNGERRRIHVSDATAKRLISAGKAHWLKAREDKIVAKGKGEMQTYWVNVKGDKATSSTASKSSTDEVKPDQNSISVIDADLQGSSGLIACDEMQVLKLGAKTLRLIDWNVDLLLRLLKHIVARRKAKGNSFLGSGELKQDKKRGAPLDEVKEIIRLPKFDAKVAMKEVDPMSLDLGVDVEDELRNFVTTIAMLYRDNPFHSFEHASHVAMSAMKLLSRIIAPSELAVDKEEMKGNRRSSLTIASSLHDHTYGITSDPLTQFACVFSALVHDVDHTGVPNTQLIAENATIASLYQNKSVAEQNSVDLSWNLLMDPGFSNLRRAIYSTESEFVRFRQLVVNSVMATDIMDKDLKQLRNARWEKAFNDASDLQEESPSEMVNRKATIVIEHLIQASDVSHTMQHWHIYTKWNQRLFEEMYVAYKVGRSEKDPSESWYEGELGFFDFYIIPLAKKLKDCGVFGVSSDEYLNYAEHNRQEWEAKGRGVVEEMKRHVASWGSDRFKIAVTPAEKWGQIDAQPETAPETEERATRA